MDVVLRAAGHLAVWAGLYVAAAVVLFAQLLGCSNALGAVVLLYAWSTAVFAYLLDRVKLRDAWADPADRVAHPRRYAFLLHRPVWVRLLMAVMAVVSMLSGWALHPVAPLATLAAGVGVLVYAGLPRGRRPRVKDRFVLKNLFVSAGITAFAGIVLVMATAPAEGRWIWGDAGPLLPLLTATHLGLRVYADAVLCDIDDEAADRTHDTRTLPTRLGADRAWRIAMWIRLALAASLLLWPVGAWEPRIAWAAVTALSTVGLRLWRPRRVRDLVDARLALEAFCVWALLAW